MITFLVYLIGVIDNLKSMIGVFAFILMLVAGGILFRHIVYLAEGFNISKTDIEIYKLGKRFLLASAILLVLAAVTPTSKVIAAMAIIPPIVENQEAQKLPENIVKFLNQYLEQYTGSKDI